MSDVNDNPENMVPDEPATNEPDEVETLIKQKRNDPQPPPGPSDTVAIPRAALNYLVVALVFFVLGGLMGSFVFPSDNGQAALPENFETVVREAVNDAIESAGLVEDPGLVMGEAYEIDVDYADDPFLGNPNAPVTILEFSDFTCGFCGRFAEDTLDAIVEEYGDQVRFVYMDYPFLSQMSVPAALAAECAQDQGQFWAMHDALFANQRGLSEDSIQSIASDLDLDIEQFNTCFDNGEHIEEIRADAAYAQELGVSGTPAFFVNGRFVSGAQSIDVFRQFIDEELAEQSS